uniref:Uncharacterized protein n=1 Tax=Anguilla anguilla TaxID=7936 RepID=A0A0E9VW18_ANGAN
MLLTCKLHCQTQMQSKSVTIQ